ncbi:MAG: toprim domain-containing protein [Sulfuricellaceae bacterium]|nr:toprim domain-containing protein [Sulfuricellaceae bacterium]
MISFERKFLDALRSAGLEPVKADIDADGVLHRYRVTGDKAGSMNGWYVLHASPVPAGAFGSWKTGETHSWRDDVTRTATPAERAELQRQMQAMKAARAEEERRVRDAARAKAAKLWLMAKPAPGDHPYLARKRVKAWGLRQLNNMLLIPARDAAGQLHTLQFIGADGNKRFLTGGRIQGCYYAIGRVRGAVLVAEGYATAASIFEASGHAVAVAFNAGNLEPVARAIRSKFPKLHIVICADDDTATPGNPGLTKATEAARAVHGWVAKPDFSGVAA